MNKRTVSIIQLLITGILWSLGGLFIKLIDMNPLAISAMRSLIASLTLLFFLRWKPNFIFTLPQILGALCYVGTVSLFVLANKTTTAANAILLQYGAPIYVAILAHFILKERLKWFDYVSMAFIGVGMVIFFADSISNGSLFGNICATLSGVTFAGQAICLGLQRRGSKQGSQIETILLGNILAFLIGLPFIAITPPTLSSLAPLLTLGFFQLGIPYILYPLASRNATALDLIIIPMVEPLLNPVWVFLGTGEKPGLPTVVGGTIVLSMVLFKAYFSIKTSKHTENS